MEFQRNKETGRKENLERSEQKKAPCDQGAFQYSRTMLVLDVGHSQFHFKIEVVVNSFVS